MGTTTEFDVQKIKDEILNKFRYTFNSSDTKSRVTETTTTKTTTTVTKYSLGNTMNYIKSVTLDGTLLTFVTDYIIHWRGTDKGKIELTSAPSADLDLVIVWGSVGTQGSFVYPDFPRNDLSEDKYPRIGFNLGWSRDLAGMAGSDNAAFVNDGLLQIKIIALSTAQVNELILLVDNYIIDNFRDFYYLRYIKPTSIATYDNFSDNTSKPFSAIIEYSVPDKYQIR